MHKSANKQGYTIVEVMIFLAISGFMFVLAASFVSGKQSKVEFKDSVYELNSQIRRVINDVANGYYPSQGGYGCSAGSSGAPSFSTGSTSQGKHQGCVFIGKVMHFRAGGSAGKYNIYSVAGRQYKTSAADGTLPVSFTEAAPKPVNLTGTIDLTERNTLKWGTTVYSMKSGSGGTQLDGFGFFSSNPSYGNDSLQSGSQTVEVVTFDGSGSANDLDASINGAYLDSHLQKSPNIVICLLGGRNEHATIIIGGGTGQRLSTDVKLYGTVNPAVCT